MNLKDKLNNLDVIAGSSVVIKRSKAKISNLEKLIPGHVCEDKHGFYYKVELEHPQNKPHGQYSLTSNGEIDPKIFSLVGKDPTLASLDLSKTIFIDTETTGLAGGTGTVPFLVGIGYYTENSFQVDQYFMRDYHEERAVLNAIRERFAHFKSLVSYNGKSYDLNLLNTRYTLARIENPFADMPHLDLLHTSRRLWKRRLGDCSLGNIENKILGFERFNDVPGFMIPGLYFDFIRSGDAKPLSRVFEHNQWDILSLAGLAIQTALIHQAPHKHLEHAEDLLGLARTLDDMMQYHLASRCYKKALSLKIEPDTRKEVLTQFGFSLKRTGHLRYAEKVWKHMVKNFPNVISSYEELAKYYEHHTKDLERAKAVVQYAVKRLDLLDELYTRTHFQEDRRDLEYRLERIQRKLHKLKELNDKNVILN